MIDKIFRRYLRLPALALVAVALVAGPSFAADVTLNLTAEQRSVTMPDPDGGGPLVGEVITMWGFFDVTDTGTTWTPGPRPAGLVAGDTLTINLTNNLTVPVSIVMPGQVTALNPVFSAPDAQGRQRVTSFTTETPPDGTTVVTYTWTSLKAGTFLYQSGTQPSLQVPMGLYGALTVDAGPGEAYPGVAYDSEVLLLYSEIDPTQHTAAVGATPLTYKPEYFLINGQPFDPLAPTPPINAGGVGQSVLIRLLNAGLKSHMPMLLNGGYLGLVAEDGNPYPYPREQYSAHLAPGKTIDALWNPTAQDTYSLFDRSHHLTSGGLGNGGMLAQLLVGPGTVNDTVTILRTRHIADLNQLRVWADSTGAPGAVLTLFSPDATGTNHGALNFIGNVDYDYRKFAPAVVSNPGSVAVTSDQGGSDSQPVPFTAPPVATADAYSVNEGDILTEPAAGVLTNDTRGGYFLANNGLEAELVTGPANAGAFTLNADGSFSYTHNGSETLFDTFTYVANAVNTTNSNVLANGSEALVTLSINPVNDAPVAVNDTASTDDDTPVAIDVLANDTDADGDVLTIATFDAVGTAGGSITCDTANPGGTCSYTSPGGLADPTDDTFTYTATDGTDVSNTATVTVTVSAAANQPPVAVDDFAAFTIGVDTSIVINVTDNDADVDGTIVLNTVCLRFFNYPANCIIPDRTTKNGGTATNNYNGTVTYTPPPGFLGTDLFRYSVEDNNGAVSNKARVRVNVVQ